MLLVAAGILSLPVVAAFLDGESTEGLIVPVQLGVGLLAVACAPAIVGSDAQRRAEQKRAFAPRSDLVDAAGRQQLLGANDAKLLAQFGADEVLATIAAGAAEVAGFELAAVGEVGEQTGVFVVGVGGDVHHRAHYVELFET